VLETEPARRGPDRRADRLLTYLGLATAIGFLVAALASLALPSAARLGAWLPLHLVLAGAVGTAVAAMLPFFVAALSVARPAPASLRVASLILVAGGAVAGVLGRVASGGGPSAVAAAGAAAYVAGMGAVALCAVLALRGRAGRRRPATELAYAVALLDVMAGVALVALFLAGDAGVAARWAGLRVGHAWLNLVGFATLVVAGTLIHFAPTVAGSRIRVRRSGGLAVGLLAVAAPLAAVGYALGTDPDAGMTLARGLVVVGATAAGGGALALTWHGIRAHTDRAGWTTDPAWHRFTGSSLLLAPAWLLVAAVLAVTAALEHGADPQGWRLDRVGAPLVLGFVVQVLLGALSHLLPAVGPGTPEAHAEQRRVLGRAATGRLVCWNAGVGLLTLGLAVGGDGLSAGAGSPANGAALMAFGGLGIAAASGASTVLLLVAALRAR
jgi:nitrite reductase (NO-forming)